MGYTNHNLVSWLSIFELIVDIINRDINHTENNISKAIMEK